MLNIFAVESRRHLTGKPGSAVTDRWYIAAYIAQRHLGACVEAMDCSTGFARHSVP